MLSVDLQGQRFGHLIVLTSDRRRGRKAWLCQCECGNRTVVITADLNSGNIKGCGCLVRLHGMSKTRAHRTWRLMLTRCFNSHERSWKLYGGRGIKVCDRWKQSFLNFYGDMGDPPPGMSIDRINNDGNYEPENCRWATAKEQARNKSSSRLLSYGGKTQSMAAWAEERGIRLGTLHARLVRGWSVERAINVPIRNFVECA